MVNIMKKTTNGKFKVAGLRLGNLVEEKNANYGDSLKDKQAFLELLFPNGIPPEHYVNSDVMGRMFDKFKRVATNPGAYGENPWNDVAGYALRMSVMFDEKKRKKIAKKMKKDVHLGKNTYDIIADQAAKNVSTLITKEEDKHIIGKQVGKKQHKPGCQCPFCQRK